jgi:LPXTG-motif cell wall-anchored protein
VILAFTGASGLWLGGVGLLALVAGGLLIVASKRRKTEEEN